MRIVILGCGRVGARVANALSASYDVTVIDWNTRAFDRLNSDFGGETILGNGIDADVLKSARVSSAQLFLALTDGDNRNLMAAQLASRLGVPKVVARLYDPVRAEVYEDVGITTVSPTVNGAQSLFDLVTQPEEGE
jgi:trk system potassium uptake protein TrkA